jgi:hypothetical protein
MTELPELEDDVTLLEVLDRVLNTGVVIVGDVMVRVAQGLGEKTLLAPARTLADALEAHP